MWKLVADRTFDANFGLIPIMHFARGLAAVCCVPDGFGTEQPRRNTTWRHHFTTCFVCADWTYVQQCHVLKELHESGNINQKMAAKWSQGRSAWQFLRSNWGTQKLSQIHAAFHGFNEWAHYKGTLGTGGACFRHWSSTNIGEPEEKREFVG